MNAVNYNYLITSLHGRMHVLDIRDLLFIIIEGMIGFVAVSLNTLVVIAIWKNSSLHTVTNVLICNLAAADISVGLVVTPTSIMSVYGLPSNFYGCILVTCVMYVPTNTSVIMLLVIALDRFFTIKAPFMYQRVMTMSKVYFINVFVWLVGLGIGFMPMYGWHCPYKKLTFCKASEVITSEQMVYLQFFVLIMGSSFVMFIVYMYIFCVARRQSKVIEELNKRFANNSELSLAKHSYRRDIKAARMIVLVVALIFCRTPLKILHCITLYCKTCKFPEVLTMTAILVGHSNSCWNPLLYAASNYAIRSAIRNLLDRIAPEIIHSSSTIASSQTVASLPAEKQRLHVTFSTQMEPSRYKKHKSKSRENISIFRPISQENKLNYNKGHRTKHKDSTPRSQPSQDTLISQDNVKQAKQTAGRSVDVQRKISSPRKQLRQDTSRDKQPVRQNTSRDKQPVQNKPIRQESLRDKLFRQDSIRDKLFKQASSREKIVKQVSSRDMVVKLESGVDKPKRKVPTNPKQGK